VERLESNRILSVPIPFAFVAGTCAQECCIAQLTAVCYPERRALGCANVFFLDRMSVSLQTNEEDHGVRRTGATLDRWPHEPKKSDSPSLQRASNSSVQNSKSLGMVDVMAI